MGEICASVHNKLHLTYLALSEQFKFPAMSVLGWYYPLASICLSYRFILAVICIIVSIVKEMKKKTGWKLISDNVKRLKFKTFL